MLSYRHSFHAGNFADVLKHTVLVHCLHYMGEKEKGLRVIDTHAGAGAYTLDSSHAQKNREFNTGIAAIWDADTVPQAIEAYLACVRAYNPSRLQLYPGSPMLIQHALRRQDSAFFHELHPTDFATLQNTFRSDKRIRVINQDGMAGLSALLPPPDRRALVLIDPSYELKSDYHNVVVQLMHAHRRFETGVYLLWYPVVSRQRIVDMEAKLRRSGIRNILQVEWGLHPDGQGAGMTASGLFVINPPWTLERAMAQSLPWLVTTASGSQQAFYRLVQLVAE